MWCSNLTKLRTKRLGIRHQPCRTAPRWLGRGAARVLLSSKSPRRRRQILARPPLPRGAGAPRLLTLPTPSSWPAPPPSSRRARCAASPAARSAAAARPSTTAAAIVRWRTGRAGTSARARARAQPRMQALAAVPPRRQKCDGREHGMLPGADDFNIRTRSHSRCDALLPMINTLQLRELSASSARNGWRLRRLCGCGCGWY